MPRRYTPPQEEPYYSVETEPAEQEEELIGLPEEQYRQAIELQRQMEALGPRPPRPRRGHGILGLLSAPFMHQGYEDWNARATQIKEALKELKLRGQMRRAQERDLRQQSKELEKQGKEEEKSIKLHADLQDAIAREKELREKLSQKEIPSAEATRYRRDWEKAHRKARDLWQQTGKEDRDAVGAEEEAFHAYEDAQQRQHRTFEQQHQGFQSQLDEQLRQEQYLRSIGAQENMGAPTPQPPHIQPPAPRPPSPQGMGGQSGMSGGSRGAGGGGKQQHTIAMGPSGMQINLPPQHAMGLLQTLFSGMGGGKGGGAMGVPGGAIQAGQGMGGHPGHGILGMLQKGFGGMGGGMPGAGGGGGMTPGQVGMRSPGANIPSPPPRPQFGAQAAQRMGIPGGPQIPQGGPPIPPARPQFAAQAAQRMGIPMQAPQRGVSMPQGQGAPPVTGTDMSGNFAEAVGRARGMPSQVGPPTPPPRPDLSSGQGNAQQIYQYWKGQGLPDAAARALTGAAGHESNFSPGAVNRADAGTGIYQWTDTRGSPRATQMRQALGGPGNLQGQLGYAKSDLQQHFPQLWKNLNNPNISQRQAATQFAQNFEGGQRLGSPLKRWMQPDIRAGSSWAPGGDAGTMLARGGGAPEGLQMASTRGGAPRPQAPMPPPRPQWMGIPTPPSRPQTPMPPSRPQGLTPPRPGTVMGGYRFMGGDPSKRENWETVQ